MVVLKDLMSPWIGPAAARRDHRRLVAGHRGLATGLAELNRQCPADDADDPEQPIFLLSAGWRSGSTLLQRLLMSDKKTLIWGEPYDECGMIQALADSLQAFRPGWPPDEYYYDGTPPGELTGSWVANLFPALEDLRAGHRALFDRLFAEPARRAGAARWGIKEVRLTAEHAAYLRWLYPRARFLLLYRHPLDAYRSYNRYGRNWYDTFPARPVFTPKAFGTHWQDLVGGFVRDADRLGALLIRYEDLVNRPSTLDELEAYLGMSIDHSTTGKKVGSSAKAGQTTEVKGVERFLLRRAASPMAEHLGYTW